MAVREPVWQLAPPRRRFSSAIQRRFRFRFWDELEAGRSNPVKHLEAQVARQRQQVESVMTALLAAPGSKALSERLKVEERKLEDLEAQLQVAAQQRPRIIPHPAAIARYVQELAATLEGGDVAKASSILRRALAPFRMVPEAGGYRMTGALDLGVCDGSSSGDVI